MEDANAIFENIFSLPCKVSEGKKKQFRQGNLENDIYQFCVGRQCNRSPNRARESL